MKIGGRNINYLRYTDDPISLAGCRDDESGRRKCQSRTASERQEDKIHDFRKNTQVEHREQKH